MTPDIRERAERLWRDMHETEMVLLSAKFPDYDEYIAAAANLISQALLEAHNAGRAEAMAEIEAEREVSPAEAAELHEIIETTLVDRDVQDLVRQGNALLEMLGGRSIK